MRRILGISAFYHDSAAALLVDGNIAAAAQEERFSRRKNDEGFPRSSIAFCLRRAGLRETDLDAVAFYDKPILKFARLLETSLAIAPRGWRRFIQTLPNWLEEKLDVRRTIRRELEALPRACPIFFTEHHQAHAASAFYPSPFRQAAILTADGVGEWTTTSVGVGQDAAIELRQELRFPHSLGLLYSAFTAYCGFRVNSGEYKLMGLAPYGEPQFVRAILDQLLDLKPDGSFRLNLDYFDFLAGCSMTNERFHRLFGGPPRPPEAPIDARHLHAARSIQEVTEEIMLRLARRAQQITGQKRLCLAGGVALNCVANGRIVREKIFEEIWIQPAAGDAGGALGAALAVWHDPAGAGQRARAARNSDAMEGALLGPEFSDAEIEAVLRREGAVYRRLDERELLRQTARWIGEQKVVGWFQGRMEFGPRALGSRSILADPRSPEMQAQLNLKIKFRESFRPFAPAVLAERAPEFFEMDGASPYMLLVAALRREHRLATGPARPGLEQLQQLRSKFPAVTHVDFSARIQTVDAERNPKFYRLLKEFEAQTGCPMLVNTSFNVRGEPLICSPDDAWRCFLSTQMDALAIGSFLLQRSDQPPLAREKQVRPQAD